MIQLFVICLCIPHVLVLIMMIIGKLYHYCTNNQKTGNSEQELCVDAPLKSVVGATIEPTAN